MSTAAQMAKVEAAIAENELTEAETEQLHEHLGLGAKLPEALSVIMESRQAPEREPEREPEPEPEPSGEPTERQLQQLDAEVQRHLGTVGGIMGALVAGFEPCEHCGGVGLLPPNAPRTHEDFQPCATCSGWGEVLTGSKRAGQESRDCPTCRGRGYLERLNPDGSPASPQSNGPQPPPPPSPAPPPIIEPPALGNGQRAPEFGVPTWMGDPSLGR